MDSRGRDDTVSFGAWVRKRRRALDLTQAQLGDLSACTESAVRKIESDERRPSRRIAEKLADALRIPATERERFIETARGLSRVDRLEDVPEEGDDPAPGPRGNLPPQATALIGREADIERVARLLEDPARRLVTITGPGGIGKSRLALAAAAAARSRFPDGAWLALLVAAQTEDMFVSSLGQALGVTFSIELDAITQLENYLRTRSILVVLDNFEQLLAATPLVARLLAAAPQLRFLVTSRERLNLAEEWLVALEGLQLEGGGDGIAPAVRLFCERAQRVRADFPADAAEMAEAADICRAVDGLPLAIELAAAWVRMLPCAEIRDEIRRNVDFLATTARDAPARHASLRAAFDYSLRLLSEDECRAFVRLSVFRSPFDREAARVVAGASLPMLAALADKSLVKPLGSGRFTLHELLRQFAAEVLARDPTARDAVEEDYGRHFVTSLAAEEATLAGARAVEAAARLLPMLPDYRAATLWIPRHRSFRVGLRFGQCLMWLYETAGLYREAIEHFGIVLELTRALEPGDDEADHLNIVAHSEVALGFYLVRWGRLEEGYRHYVAGEACARRLSDQAPLAMILGGRGLVAALLGHTQEGADCLAEVATLKSMVGWPGWAGLRDTSVGYGLVVLGRVDEAERWLLRAIADLTPDGHPGILGLTHYYLGKLYASSNRREEARAELTAARDIWVRLFPRHPNLSVVDTVMGRLAVEEGRYDNARAMLERALDHAQNSGFVPYVALALVGLGELAGALGEHDEAVRHFQRAVEINREMHHRRGTLRSMQGLAISLLNAGRLAESYGVARELAQLALEAGMLRDARRVLKTMASRLGVEVAPAEPDAETERAALQALLDRMPVSVAASAESRD